MGRRQHRTIARRARAVATIEIKQPDMTLRETRCNVLDTAGPIELTAGPIEFFAASSTSNAFEFHMGSTVPEPSTWAMMLVGFAGIGFRTYRKTPS